MATFSNTDVILRATGKPASAGILIGSQARLALVYVGANRDPVDISGGWTVEAKAELYYGEFDEDDQLKRLKGDPLDNGQTYTIEVAIDDNPTVNIGVFYVRVKKEDLPVAYRDVHIDSVELPTFAIWVKFTAPGDSVIDQARVAVGFRRGFGSLKNG